MSGAYLPGNSTAVLREVPVPEPGHGEVLLRMKASTICGSDIRAIYHEHLGKGPEGYQDVIAGHEPCGRIVKTGPGCRRFGAGDRVIVYHISGCGLCNDCRRGYMISCTSEKYRRASSLGSLAIIDVAGTIPACTKPRASAVAIRPAPMNPILIESIAST